MKSRVLPLTLALSMAFLSADGLSHAIWAQSAPQNQPARTTPQSRPARTQAQNQTQAPTRLAQNRPATTPPKPSLPARVQATPKPAASAKPAPKPGPQDRVRIYADKAIYQRQQKQAEAIGHVKIIQDNTTIYADKVHYNEASKQSTVETGVKIVQVNKTKDKGRTTTITAAKMTAYHQERRMLLREQVRMDRDAAVLPTPAAVAVSKAEQRARTERAIEKARTVVTSDQMEYFTRTEDANLEGTVVVLQKEKRITGDKAFIRGEQSGDFIVVEGKAEVTQINGNWLIRNKIIKEDPADEEQQRMVREKLVINADKITLFRATDDLKAEGNVKITQKVGNTERVATGKEATFSDKAQLATLIGNVRFKRENADWLTGEKALFYTDKEVFEATGTPQQQVVSEFTIPDEENPTPPPPINPPLPEFDLDKHQPGERLPSWLQKGGQGGPQRAPASPAGPQSRPANSPRPPRASAKPAPSPVASPSPSPTPKPTPQPTPSPSPSRVESEFSIPTD